MSNSFYWVAVRAGMRIVERHRHGLDLFPDQERTVPFGCGATVVSNYADFRFENPFAESVLMRARVDRNPLASAALAEPLEVWEGLFQLVDLESQRLLDAQDVRSVLRKVSLDASHEYIGAASS